MAGWYPLALEAGIRGGAATLALFLAMVVGRHRPLRRVALLGALFLVGVAAFAIEEFSAWVYVGAPAVRGLLVGISNANSVVFWLFACALFNDGFRLRPWHALLWFGYGAFAFADCQWAWPHAVTVGRAWDALLQAGAVVFALLALAQTVREWRVDLVEARRSLRVWIVAAAALYTILNVLRQALTGHNLGGWESSGPPLLLLIVLVLVGIQLVSPRGTRLFAAGANGASDIVRLPGSTGDAVRRLEPVPASADRAAAGSSAIDPALLARLNAAMHEDEVFREPSLTIGALADRLGVHEYQLRRVINQGLGFRNFNVYLNGFRIGAVQRALSDPAQRDATILKLALAAGYQSLGPFNRAFKEATGMTPTAYRDVRTGAPIEGAPTVLARDATPLSGR